MHNDQPVFVLQPLAPVLLLTGWCYHIGSDGLFFFCLLNNIFVCIGLY